jgi:hypothetical protein
MRLAWVLTRGGGGGGGAGCLCLCNKSTCMMCMYIRTSVLVCDLPVGKLTCGSDGECADKQDNKPAERLHFSNRRVFPLEARASAASCKCVQKQRPPHDLPPIYLAQQQIVEPKIDAERESVEQV